MTRNKALSIVVLLSAIILASMCFFRRAGTSALEVAQMVIFLASIPFFDTVATRIISSKRISFTVTAVYALYFSVFGIFGVNGSLEQALAIIPIVITGFFFFLDDKHTLSKPKATLTIIGLVVGTAAVFWLGFNCLPDEKSALPLFQRIYAGAFYPIVNGQHLPDPRIFYAADFFGTNIGLIYLFLIVAIVLFFRRKLLPLRKMALILAMSMATLFVGVISTSYDFSRRIYPIIPMFLLIAAAIIDQRFSRDYSKATTPRKMQPVNLLHNRPLLIVMAASVALSAFCMVYYDYEFFSFDTKTYTDAIDVYASGRLDELRTPVYPFVLGAFRFIFGEKWMFLATIIFQNIVFIATIPLFHKIVTYFINSTKIAIATTAAYCAMNIFYGWNNWIMTESLSIAIVVAMIYLFTAVFTEGKAYHSVLLSVTLIVAILLRPIFLFFIPVVIIVGLVAIWRNNRKSGWRTIISSVSAAIVISCYAFAFNAQHGHFTISEVNAINNYSMLRTYGLISAEDCPDGKLHSRIERFCVENGKVINPELPPWHEINQIIYVDPCSVSDLKTVSDQAIENHRAEWLSHIPKRTTDAFHFNVSSRRRMATDRLLVPFNLFQPTIGALVLFLVFFVVVWVHYRPAYPFAPTLFLILAIAANIAVSIVGSIDDFDRLIAPTITWVILLVGIIADTPSRSQKLPEKRDENQP